MKEAVNRCKLNLSGAVVLTEAASGAYIVTPVLAALAGADVVAITRTTKYGAADEITEQTMRLAALARVASRIQVITEKCADVVGRADIVTNSGHVRPINSAMIGLLKESAVISLMYEAWEFRAGDVDLEACRTRRIAVAGTNEQHPAVDVFSYLGTLAVKLLLDAGIAVYGSEILVLCDNPFAPFLEKGLRGAGARVEVAASLPAAAQKRAKDAILVALRPRHGYALGVGEAAFVRECFPGAIVAQFWGDVHRAALEAASVSCWPLDPPPAGHMGILPSAAGPEPIVRLQTGGLKVGEVLWRGRGKVRHSAESEFVDAL